MVPGDENIEDSLHHQEQGGGQGEWRAAGLEEGFRHMDAAGRFSTLYRTVVRSRLCGSARLFFS
jgi:hypothetical protein